MARRTRTSSSRSTGTSQRSGEGSRARPPNSSRRWPPKPRFGRDGSLARWLQGRPEPTTLAGTPVGAVVGSARLDADAWVIVAAQKTGPAPHEIEVRLGADDGKVRSVIER